MTNNYSVEITRNNVTPAKFFAEIRFALKKKGIDFTLCLEDFAKPQDPCNRRYFIEGDIKISYDNGHRSEWPATDAACKAETITALPYDYQVYILNFDGSSFNEICEFHFDPVNDKIGQGYYYTMNKDAE